MPARLEFFASPTSGDPPLTVSFSDQSSNSPTSWSWTFGDGNSSNAQNPSHTYTSAGTYNVSLTATNSDGGDTETKTNYITVNTPASPPVAEFYFSPQSDGAIGNDEDIVASDGSGYSVVLDGSALGIGGEDLDAITRLGDGDFLISSTSSINVGGVSAADEDLVRYDSSTGQWSLYFDGSDVGLGGDRNEDIDAAHILPNGHILVSTQGSHSVPGVSGGDEDLIEFTPSSIGSSTSGTWALCFDGSDVALTNNGEDLVGVSLVSGELFLSTRGNFSAGGLSGRDEDVFRFLPASLGNGTSGTFVSPLYFDGSQNGFTNDVFALHVP